MRCELVPKVTFIEQNAPIDEYGRALYAVARSVLRALVDSVSDEDLRSINTPIDRIYLRQLANIVRFDRDKGMKGDGFEWAIHEAVCGGEEMVTKPIAAAMKRACRYVKDAAPRSLLFGHERAKYLGFLDAVVDDAGTGAALLPEGSGRPFKFDTWVSIAARGVAAESLLNDRIKKIWKTDLFLSAEDDTRHFAATVKSNFSLLEGGRGLRVGIVPESTAKGNNAGVRYDSNLGLWVVTLADPNGFMGLFNDGYHAVGRAMCTLGRLQPPPYWTKPSAKAQRLLEQLLKYPNALVSDVEGALDEAAQQDLLGTTHRLVSVNAPEWLHIKTMAPTVISPKPKFVKLD